MTSDKVLAIVVVLVCATLGEGAISSFDAAARRRCWSSSNGDAARWWNEGATIDRGSFFYTCSNGRLQPSGCFSTDGSRRRVQINASFRVKNYEVQCRLSADGYLTYKYTMCIGNDNRKYSPGQKWNDFNAKRWHSCKQDGAYLRVELGGCLSAANRQIDVSVEMTEKDEVWQCQRKWDGSVTLTSVGCVEGGRRYKIGDSWMSGEYVYYCKKVNQNSRKVCVGCTFSGRKLYDGDRYFRNDVVYRCDIRPTSNQHSPVACVDRDRQSGDIMERSVGCRWDVSDYRTSNVHKVEMMCKEREDGTNLPYREATACIYRYRNADAFYIKPGTYTVWSKSHDDTKGIGCRKIADDDATLFEFEAKDLLFKARGMKYAPPNGK